MAFYSIFEILDFEYFLDIEYFIDFDLYTSTSQIRTLKTLGDTPR